MNEHLHRMKHLAWGDWMTGLWSAFIQGGASAVVAAMGVTAIDPADFNFSTWKFYQLAAIIFLASGLIEVARFLKAMPLPKVLVEDEMIRQTQLTPPGKPDIVTETETHRETKLVQESQKESK